MILINIFFTVLEMSAKALTTAIAVLFFILPLSIRRIPKRISYMLMFIIVFRMICPFTFSSSFSIFNLDFLKEYGTRSTPAGIFTTASPIGSYETAIEGSTEFEEAINSGLIPPKNNDLHFDYVNYVRDSEGNIAPAKTAAEAYGALAAKIWFAGVLLFWGYGFITYFLLKRKVNTATIINGNIFETDQISVPFILGFIHPKIYLPLGLSDMEKRYVVCHENMHLHYGDNIMKMIVYLTMSIHWFNLLLWLWFYRIFMMLMEQACDESVLHKLGEESKADYSETLLTLSVGRHFIGAIPVAFGEGYIKDRIHDILKYKKPAVFLTIFAVILSICAIAVCGTNDFIYDNSVIKLDSDASLSNNSEIFSFIPGKNVRSVFFSFEIWTEDGLYFSQQLTGGNLKSMQLNEENTITVSHYVNDISNDKSLNMTLALNETTYINTSTVVLPSDKELTGKGTTHIGYADGSAYEAATDSTTALCSIVFTPGKWRTSVGNCVAISTSGKVEVDDGCIVALIKMQTSSKYTLPYFYNISELIPWIEETDYCNISVKDGRKEIPPDTLMEHISDLRVSQYFDFGNTNITGQFIADITLAKGRYSANFYFDNSGYIYISTNIDNIPTNLYKVLPSQQQYGSLLIEMHDLLGIDFSAAAIYGLPDTIGKTAIFNENETELLADFPQVDTSLYGFTDSGSYYLILRQGAELYSDRINYPTIISQAFCFDYDNDGSNEIAFLGSAPPEDINDDFFFVIDIVDGKFSFSTIYDFTAQLDMLISYGEYADNENLIDIYYDGSDLNGNFPYHPDSFTIDVSEYLLKSGRTSFEEISIHRDEDTNFWFENEKMLFSSGIYLEFDNSNELILCGSVSGEIVYNNALILGKLMLNGQT